MVDEKQVDIQLPKYYKSDFKKLSWEKYFKVLDEVLMKLKKYLKENKIKIHAVVPILRGGNFPGTYFAYQLHILRILPVQYKYFFNKGKIELKRMFDLPMPEPQLPEKPNFLLVENNQCYGTTAESAAKYLREKFPDCKVIHVADYADYSYQKFDVFDVSFYGQLTNDTRTLTKEKCKKLGVESFSNLFPWENIDEEWKTVHAKQFKYSDIDWDKV
jgi:hypoxanthine phosphoribosyltransferase